MKHVYYLMLLLSPVFQPLLGQNSRAIETTLNARFNTIRTGGSKAVKMDDVYQSQNAAAVVKALAPYLHDSLAEVRMEAVNILKRASLNTTDQEIRQKGVYLLVCTLRDKNSGIVGIASSALASYKKTDYTQAALDSLRNTVMIHPAHFDQIIKIIGYLGIQDMSYELHKLCAPESSYSKKIKWATHLALARMGEASEVSYCVEQVKKLPLTDDGVYTLIPDLIYTRQKASIDLVIQYLQNTDKNCSSSNPDNDTKLECGYRIMELLAPVIKDYPLELRTSGDIKTNDYTAALTTVRAWFTSKKDTYEIITDTF